MPTNKGKGEKHEGSESVAGPAAYDPSAQPTVTLSELVSVDGEENAEVEVTGGYEGEVAAVDNNVVSVQVNNVPDPATHSGSEAALSEVSSGADLSGQSIRVRGSGY